MASGQTKTYGFNQWQPEDKVLREEFNGDNEKMEQALTGLDSRVTGKAEQTEVDGLKTQLATKAAQSALDSLSASVTGGLAKKYGTDNAYIKTGNYTGTGEDSITVSVGFQPALVFILRTTSASSYDYVYMMGDAAAQIMISQFTSQIISTSALTLSGTGFTIQDGLEDYGFNAKDTAYHYLAFR